MALPDRLSARLAAYGFWRLKAMLAYFQGFRPHSSKRAWWGPILLCFLTTKVPYDMQWVRYIFCNTPMYVAQAAQRQTPKMLSMMEIATRRLFKTGHRVRKSGHGQLQNNVESYRPDANECEIIRTIRHMLRKGLKGLRIKTLIMFPLDVKLVCHMTCNEQGISFATRPCM